MPLAFGRLDPKEVERRSKAIYSNLTVRIKSNPELLEYGLLNENVIIQNGTLRLFDFEIGEEIIFKGSSRSNQYSPLQYGSDPILKVLFKALKNSGGENEKTLALILAEKSYGKYTLLGLERYDLSNEMINYLHALKDKYNPDVGVKF